MPRKSKNDFIREVTLPSGNKVLRIEIRKYNQVFRQSVNVKDFDTPGQAMQEAKRIRNEKLVDMEKGYTVSNFMTVEELYNRSFELLPVRQKTKIRHGWFYKYGIEKHGNKTIDKISKADIQESINNYARTHTKRQTQGLLSIWRRIYKTAAMEEIKIQDRTVTIVIPECVREQPKKKDISSEDLDAFCDALLEYNKFSAPGLYQSQCIYYAIQIMKYCGLRPAETFALTKNDIFLNASNGGFISINKASHSTIDSTLEIGATKTQKSIRLIPIPEDLSPILRECLLWTKYDIIFADYNGNLQDIDNVSNYVHRVAKKAKVQFNLYMLRHQLSTDLFSNGTPANVIRDIMGHESASMSLDYAVSKESDRKNAMDNRKFS